MSHAGSLFSIYQQDLAHHPNAIMLVEGDQTVSYLQFDQQVRETTAWLRQQGIEGIVEGDQSRSISFHCVSGRTHKS